ncbi:MAG: NAD-dependent epimerase/dehydratase family protein [Ferruginibacter sp.]|nr:NAD-dependent epimerase/dehydratase family protein [Ferruginibacter sp.]
MITIIGNTGFIGSHLVYFLKQQVQKKYDLFLPKKFENLDGKYLGDIIYCAGLTSDAKYKSFETIDAHVALLQRIISRSTFSSITYCSSARVYIHSKETNENSVLGVNVNENFDLFNISKLLGESLLKNTVENHKILRISNVVGDDFLSENFLTSIVKEALTQKKIKLYSSMLSSKDYIYIDDVVKLIVTIALSKEANGIYNLASGFNLSNQDIINIVQQNIDCNITYANEAKDIIFPKININRIKEEFDFSPNHQYTEYIKKFIQDYKTFIDKS